MNYYLDKEIDVKFDFDYDKIYKDVVDAVLEYFECPYDYQVSLLLVDNDSIKIINSENRGIDNATDVLSFPNIEWSLAGNFDSIDEDEDYFDPDSGELILGDIVISVDKVKSQAEEYGHSELREYAFLICHSMLHLLGFDHIDEEDRKIMEEYQSIIMKELNILR